LPFFEKRVKGLRQILRQMANGGEKYCIRGKILAKSAIFDRLAL
jgi:hypothetical protein